MTVPDRWLTPTDLRPLRQLIPDDLPALPRPVTYDEAACKPVGYCDEPLVEIPPDLSCHHVYCQLGSELCPPAIYLREGVVERLYAAQKMLPEGFSIVCLDGWRTVEFQNELLALYKGKYPGLGHGYVSEGDDAIVVAPHTTGGAIDLTLGYHSRPLALGADFDSFAPIAHYLALEDLDDDAPDQLVAARDLRRLLSYVLTENGFAPYDLEWWHFSYGEQRWAAHYDEPCSLYQRIVPHR